MSVEPRQDKRAERTDNLSLEDLLSLDRLCWMWKTGADVMECLTYALEKAANATGSSCGVIFLRERRTGKRRVGASLRVPPNTLSDGHAAKASRVFETSKEPQLLNPNDSEVSPIMVALSAAGASAGMAVPMRVDGACDGVMVLGSSDGTYSIRKLAAAAAIVSYCALAIERAKACKAAEDKVGFLETVSEISAALASERSLETVLAMVVERAAEAIDAESTSVGLLEDEGKILRCLYSSGYLKSALLGQTFDTSLYPLKNVLKSGKARILSNPSTNPRVRPIEARDWMVTSAILAPLRMKDTAIGLLAAGNKRGGVEFTKADLRVFETLANHAAVAISNSRLFERNRLGIERLEAERAKLEGILANLADGVVVCDTNNQIVMVNRAAEEIMDTHAEDIVGKNLAVLQPPEYRKTMKQMLQAMARPDGPESALYDARIEYGQKILRISASPITAAGSYQGLVVTLQDVTAMEEMGRAKSEFISTVAHELKTPLTSLKGSLGLMLRNAPGGADSQFTELLSIAENNIERLTRLVEDMTDIAKIEAGRMGLRLEMISLYECAVDAIKEVQQLAAEKSISLAVRLVGAPPPALADRDRMEQVITNLLVNAIKFSPENSEVIVSVRQIHGYARVSVQDFGPGIPRKDLKKVFDKFYQVGGPATRKDGGSGLGLAICKAIVEQHGGRIYARSSIGHGSSMVFTVPIQGNVK